MASQAAADLLDYLRDLDVAELRALVDYEGEDYDPVYVHDRVEEQFTSEEFEEITEQFILKSLDEWPNQPEFARYGHLDVVTRWFDRVVVIVIPVEEWSGVIVTFDRDDVEDTGALIDSVLDYVEDPAHGLRSGTDEPAEAAEDYFGS